MKNYKRSAKFTLFVTYFLMLVLLALCISLPFLVNWYVEIKHRPADLATVVMLTCYPCAPLAFIALNAIKNFLENLLKDNIKSEENAKYLKTLSLCCFFAGLIMFVAGFFYMPFFIASASALFCSVVVKALYDIHNAYLEKEKD